MNITDIDIANYAYTIRDNASENQLVIQQMANNMPEQALLRNFASAVDDAINNRGDATRTRRFNCFLTLLSPAGLLGFGA